MTADARPIALASDHAGFGVKETLKDALALWGYRVEDLGPASEASVDYPDYAEAVARRVSEGEAKMGVLVCGTGIGMAISANKFPKIRAALLYDDVAARFARLHNDANVAVFGARTMSAADIVTRLKIFLDERFEAGRHAGRLEKISRFEERPGR